MYRFFFQQNKRQSFSRREDLGLKVFDFLLCIILLIFRKNQSTASRFDKISVIQWTVVQEQRMDLLLQSLSLFVLAGPLIFTI